MKYSRGLAGIVAVVVFAVCVGMADAQSDTTTPSGRPTTKKNWWLKRHTAIVEQAKKGDVDLLFVGDSITQGFEGSGKDAWAKYYTPRKAMNMGFKGDNTQNVLWRLDNGELDGISPKLAVLMIGTNNGDSPEQIFEGIKAICGRLQAKLPKMKVLVLAIFPRGPNVEDWGRVKNEAVNKLIAKLADDKKIFFMDINSKLLGADGTLSKDVMPDLLHPNAKGYWIWAEAIEPTVARLMGEEAKK